MERGDRIIEKQYNATEKIVESVTPGHCVLARGIKSGRITRISWWNLNRYRVLPAPSPEAGE